MDIKTLTLVGLIIMIVGGYFGATSTNLPTIQDGAEVIAHEGINVAETAFAPSVEGFSGYSPQELDVLTEGMEALGDSDYRLIWGNEQFDTQWKSLTYVSPQDYVTVDFTDDEWAVWMQGDGLVQYNVDVQIVSSHAWERHGDAEVRAALRTCNEYGTQAVISDNISRRLHLLCRNPETGEEYVVIITKIKKAVDQFSNATSKLVTAFKLISGSTIGSYIQNEVITGQTGILVKLKFIAGELFFSP